jgi:hypothetical protein
MTQVLGVPLLLVISSELSAIKEGGKCSEHWTVTEAGISCRGRKRSSPLFWNAQTEFSGVDNKGVLGSSFLLKISVLNLSAYPQVKSIFVCYYLQNWT